MGTVIPLFGGGQPDPEPTDPDWDGRVSEELRESIADVQGWIEHMWEAETGVDFIDRLRAVKSKVAAWPDG